MRGDQEPEWQSGIEQVSSSYFVFGILILVPSISLEIVKFVAVMHDTWSLKAFEFRQKL